MRRILRNSIITPDGTDLESAFTHDFVSHTDKNGKTYAVDGGREYLRRVGDTDDCVDNSLYFDSPLSIVRRVFKWGTYGKSGREQLKYVLLMDLTVEHIKAIIRTQTQLPEHVIDLFKRELKYRKDN